MKNSFTPDVVDELLREAPAGSAVYLVGAGGCGMSGLGHLLLDLGFRVAGSDLAVNEEVRQLRARGADIREGHSAAAVEQARPVLVVYTSAVRRENPELQAAEKLRIPIVRRAMLLSALVKRKRGVCVAGMHGKTTTTSLLAFALERLGANPSYAVGALVPQLPRHARFVECGANASLPITSSVGLGSEMCISPGRGYVPANAVGAPHSQTLFVVEADESDGTLREFRPEHAILLNIDEEHLDYYENLDAIGREFASFASQVSGRLVFCADDLRLAELVAKHPGAVSYGWHPLSEYRIETPAPSGSGAAFSCRPSSSPEIHPVPPPLGAGEGAGPQEAAPCGDASKDSSVRENPFRFAIRHKGVLLGEFSTGLIGEKNISNAAAVIALLHQLGFEPARIAEAISPFRGAARRQQEIFADERFRVFDDYGHHPVEIRATLRALKSLGARRLLVAFQPHRYTRTRQLLHEFATAFREADLLWLADVYAASEPEIPGVDSALVAGAIQAQGQVAECISDITKLRAAVRAAMQPGDLVLFLGAGADITVAAQELAAQLREEKASGSDLVFAGLAARLSSETVIRRNEPLKKRTTLRVGGNADIYVEPASETELAEVLKFCAARGVKVTMLGRGSNLLVRDGGIRGVVICLAHPEFSRIEIDGGTMRCGAGVRLKTLAVEARRHGLAGLEFLEGIPGSVGGAMRMNAGAMGQWMFDVIERIRFMDFEGRVHERLAGEVAVEYRGCPLLKTHIALSAVIKGQRATEEVIRQRMDSFSRKRWESQPNQPSAGCIFKNPGSIPAGKLVDELGLKGTRVGGAMVSDVHANFIVNDGDASARDVLNLIEIIKERARSARGIELQTEVEILGEG